LKERERNNEKIASIKSRRGRGFKFVLWVLFFSKGKY
jgi:hypothetical protein